MKGIDTNKREYTNFEGSYLINLWPMKHGFNELSLLCVYLYNLWRSNRKVLAWNLLTSLEMSMV